MTQTVVPFRAASGVGRVVDWVRDHQDRIAHEASESIWAEIPAYGHLADDALRQEVEAHCRQVFTAFIASVDEDRHPEPSDFPWTAQHAMRRVQLGVGLTDFMQAFRVGQLTLWEHILDGVQHRPDTKDAALLLVEQVMRTIEVGSCAAAEAYLAHARETTADSTRLSRDLLEDLIAGRPPGRPERVAVLERLGLHDDVGLVVIVARFPEGTGPEVHHVVRSRLSDPQRGLVVVRQREVVSVLPVREGGASPILASLRTTLAGLAAQGIHAGVGVSTVRLGPGQVRQAWEDAQLALSTLDGRPGLIALDEMSTLDYLVRTHDPGAARLIPPEVRAFVADDLASGGVLLGTLREYVACDLNAKLAALELHVHANTVYYRLERIAERTGCDLRRVEQLIELLLAVRLVRAERG